MVQWLQCCRGNVPELVRKWDWGGWEHLDMRNESLEPAFYDLVIFQLILIVFDRSFQKPKKLHLKRHPGDKCPWNNSPTILIYFNIEILRDLKFYLFFSLFFPESKVEERRGPSCQVSSVFLLVTIGGEVSKTGFDHVKTVEGSV